MVQNYMETLVRNALTDELADHPEKYREICQCPSCTAHIMAEALNLLKPFYVTCVAGEVFGEYHSKEMQNLSDIMVAVGKGLQAAMRLPHNGGGQ